MDPKKQAERVVMFSRKIWNCLVVLLLLSMWFVFPRNYGESRIASLSTQGDSYLPPGEGKELLNVLCSSCHDIARVITQRRDSETWKQTVDEMLAAWNPRYSEYLGDDVEALSRYLALYFGPLIPSHETLQRDAKLREKYLRGEIQSLININTASLAELTKLPGISERTAEVIIRYRKTHGPFKSSGDLKTLRGIGEPEFEKLRLLITVN